MLIEPNVLNETYEGLFSKLLKENKPYRRIFKNWASSMLEVQWKRVKGCHFTSSAGGRKDKAARSYLVSFVSSDLSMCPDFLLLPAQCHLLLYPLGLWLAPFLDSHKGLLPSFRPSSLWWEVLLFCAGSPNTHLVHKTSHNGCLFLSFTEMKAGKCRINEGSRSWK